MIKKEWQTIVVILCYLLCVDQVFAAPQALKRTNEQYNAYQEGVDYIRLPHALRDNTTKGITELISYFCSHCYQFEKIVQQLQRETAFNEWEKVPIIGFPGKSTRIEYLYQRGRLVAQRHKLTPYFDYLLFHQIHRQHQSVKTTKEMIALFKMLPLKTNIAEPDWKAELADPKIIKLAWQQRMLVEHFKQMQPLKTPTIIVNSRCLVKPQSTKKTFDDYKAMLLTLLATCQ